MLKRESERNSIYINVFLLNQQRLHRAGLQESWAQDPQTHPQGQGPGSEEKALSPAGPPPVQGCALRPGPEGTTGVSGNLGDPI